jgi:hypothetical protein
VCGERRGLFVNQDLGAVSVFEIPTPIIASPGAVLGVCHRRTGPNICLEVRASVEWLIGILSAFVSGRPRFPFVSM